MHGLRLSARGLNHLFSTVKSAEIPLCNGIMSFPLWYILLKFAETLKVPSVSKEAARCKAFSTL